MLENHIKETLAIQCRVESIYQTRVYLVGSSSIRLKKGFVLRILRYLLELRDIKRARYQESLPLKLAQPSQKRMLQ